jgi:hypothetical protein
MSTETRYQYEDFCARQVGAFTPSDLLRLGAAMLYRNLVTIELQIAIQCDRTVPKLIRDDAAIAGLRAVLRVMGASMAKVTIASEVLSYMGQAYCCWAVGEGLTVRYGCTKLREPTESFWKSLKYQIPEANDRDVWQDDLATWLAERGIGVTFSFGEG